MFRGHRTGLIAALTGLPVAEDFSMPPRSPAACWWCDRSVISGAAPRTYRLLSMTPSMRVQFGPLHFLRQHTLFIWIEPSTAASVSSQK